MFTTFVFIHILHKNYKQESQKTYNCIPSRLELTNRTPVKNKEQAEIHQNQPKNLDEKIHSRTGRMSGRPLELQGTQSQRCKRKNEINNDNTEHNIEEAMIKSYHCWKTRKKKTNYIVMTKS